MELAMMKDTGAAGATLKVADSAFAQPYNKPLVHQVVTAYQAGARQGTRAQKNRSAVSGGGAKPWNQKGTGRARAGTSRSPIWRKGGVTFAAQPQNHSQKVNRKMYRKALGSILSELVREERLVVIEKFDVETPKTKGLLAKLDKMGLDDVLIIASEISENLYLAARNVYQVDVRDVVHVDPVSLMAFKKILMTSDAVKHLEEQLG